MRARTVVGHGGVALAVKEFGPQDAPSILFVHGWSQASMSWKHQYESDLADDYRLVVFDLRGHGSSGVPEGDAAYTDPAVWADDIAAVIEQCGLDRPLLLGWSHGSFLVCDYLRAHGDAALGGVALMSWAVRMGDTPEMRAYIGPGFEDYALGSTDPDLATNVTAMRSFVEACIVRPISRLDHEEMLCYNMVVTPSVRSAVARHEPCDNRELLAGISVPLWAGHGDADQVVLPAALDLVREAAPTALFSTFAGCGHAPFLEDPDTFNRQLRAFAADTLTGSAGNPTQEV